jgi:uncharacterized protein
MQMIPYFLLMTAVAPAWLGRARITFALVIAASVIALPFAQISFAGWFVVLILGLSLWLPQKFRWRGWKLIASSTVFIVLAEAMSHHFAPGFNNLAVVRGVRLSESSIPFSLYLNFDKAVVGIFLLLFYLRPMNLTGFRANHLRIAGVVLGALILSMIPLSWIFNYARFDVKFPAITWIWLLNNLLFVCMSEEALYRGFVQGGLMKFKILPAWLPLVVGAVGFGLHHFKGGPAYMLFATIAGLFYGYAFYKTRRLESSILVHFSFNCVHFFFFSYPALA